MYIARCTVESLGIILGDCLSVNLFDIFRISDRAPYQRAWSSSFSTKSINDCVACFAISSSYLSAKISRRLRAILLIPIYFFICKEIYYSRNYRYIIIVENSAIIHSNGYSSFCLRRRIISSSSINSDNPVLASTIVQIQRLASPGLMVEIRCICKV